MRKSKLINNSSGLIDLSNIDESVNITGNLNITGTTTTLNSVDLIVHDKYVQLNSGASGVEQHGIQVLQSEMVIMTTKDIFALQMMVHFIRLKHQKIPLF